MAQPNYQYEKRQRDLAKQKKKEEKQQRKSLKNGTSSTGGPVASAHEQNEAPTRPIEDA
jgi:hypothetical protein